MIYDPIHVHHDESDIFWVITNMLATRTGSLERWEGYVDGQLVYKIITWRPDGPDGGSPAVAEAA